MPKGYQVGKSRGGVPISAEDVEYEAARISAALDLSSQTLLIDYGAGNGLLTEYLADNVGMTIAIEVNAWLASQIDASKYSNVVVNTTLARGLQTAKSFRRGLAKDFKVGFLANEVWQYMSDKEREILGKELMQLLHSGDSVLFSGIPDQTKKNAYAADQNTTKTQRDLDTRMGRWEIPRCPEQFAKLALNWEIVTPSITVTSGHWRFDVLGKS